jgi:hypothetical protein
MGLLRLFVRASGDQTIVLPLGWLHNSAQGLSDRWRVWRTLRRCTELSDSSLENAPVRARGIVQPLGESLVAPLSGRMCVAYRSRAWPLGSPNPVDGALQEVVQVRPFVLDRGDEKILVDGDYALFRLPLVKLSPRNLERETTFLVRQGARTRSGWFGEAVLEVGSHITVAGTLQLVQSDVAPSVADAERGPYRAAPAASRRITGNHDAPLAFTVARASNGGVKRSAP